MLNCTKEYLELETCDGLSRAFIGEGVRSSSTFDKQQAFNIVLLMCLRAEYLRKSDPPDFYEKPYPR